MMARAYSVDPRMKVLEAVCAGASARSAAPPIWRWVSYGGDLGTALQTER